MATLYEPLFKQAGDSYLGKYKRNMHVFVLYSMGVELFACNFSQLDQLMWMDLIWGNGACLRDKDKSHETGSKRTLSLLKLTLVVKRRMIQTGNEQLFSYLSSRWCNSTKLTGLR